MGSIWTLWVSWVLFQVVNRGGRWCRTCEGEGSRWAPESGRPVTWYFYVYLYISVCVDMYICISICIYISIYIHIPLDLLGLLLVPESQTLGIRPSLLRLGYRAMIQHYRSASSVQSPAESFCESSKGVPHLTRDLKYKYLVYRGVVMALEICD